jgi:hypothetical protein
MIFVHRDAHPIPAVREALDKKIKGKGITELEDARIYYQAVPAPSKAYDFDRYSCDEVCQELDSIYSEKCAYCESKYAAVKARNIEHYRPKGGVTEFPQHPGYWWLAGRWSNLLPSCPACNQIRHHVLFDPAMTIEEIEYLRHVEGEHRAGKGNAFPLNGTSVYAVKEADSLNIEDPLLINPSIRNPNEHLEWVFRWEVGSAIWDAEWVFPFLRPKMVNGNVDPYGKASIAIYALNRLKLVLERMAYVKTVQIALLPVVLTMQDLADTTEEKKQEFKNRLDRYWENLEKLQTANQPYRGMTAAFLNAVQPELRRLQRNMIL